MDIETAKSIQRRIESSDMKLDDQAQVAEGIQALSRHWVSTLLDVEMKGQMGAPDWKGFEVRIWKLGESLRLFLRRKKRWRGRGPVLDAVAGLLADSHFGKGRQTLALVLGEYGGQEYGGALGRALRDRDVWGHAIKALTKAKVSGFEAEVAGVQAQEAGWIRSAARKYLQGFKRSLA